MIIDSHVHFIGSSLNKLYIQWLKESGNTDFGPLYLWTHPAFQDMEEQIQNMDTYHIDTSIITYSANVSQLIHVLSDCLSKRRQIVQYLNQTLLSMQKKYPTRILPCAWVDLQDLDSLEEQMRQIKKDGFLAVSILCAYHDENVSFVDHPKYAPFWKLAAEMDLPVFIHFSNLYRIEDKANPLSGYMADTLLYAGMGQLMEDSLCVIRLILSGLLDTYPNLKIVMGQLGGTFPFMIERFDMLYTMYLQGAKQQGLQVTDIDNQKMYLRKLSAYKKNIYVDTHSMSVESIQAAVHILGDEHILYGSDFPITPSSFGRKHGLLQIQELPKSIQEKILYKNARKLLYSKEKSVKAV